MEASSSRYDQTVIESRMDGYKQAINNGVQNYATDGQFHLPEIAKLYGDVTADTWKAYLDLLKGDGNRTRGTLVIAGYEMFGGTEPEIAVQAGVAVELIQASLLILDDIQDGDVLRRGMPCLHTIFGEASAMNIANVGIHEAVDMLSELDIPDKAFRQIVKSLMYTLKVTGYGQTADNNLTATSHPTLDNIYAVAEAKTAYYTIFNPLQIGITLAGGTSEDVADIKDFSIHTGIAYQLRNDLKIIDKDDRGDISGNKPTVLMHHVLNHSSLTDGDRGFLESILGQADIADEDFRRCQQILHDYGAVAHVHKEIKQRNQNARDSLPASWPPDRLDFLKRAAAYIGTSQTKRHAAQ